MGIQARSFRALVHRFRNRRREYFLVPSPGGRRGLGKQNDCTNKFVRYGNKTCGR